MMSDERRARLEQGAIEAVRRDVDRQMMERADREDQEPMSDERMSEERWKTLKGYLLSLDVWDEKECEEIAAEVDRLRAENALRSQQIDALQSALESECERNRQREDELLGRLAEAERVLMALSDAIEKSPGNEISSDTDDAFRRAQDFIATIKHHPAAQPEPQPPTAGEERQT